MPGTEGRGIAITVDQVNTLARRHRQNFITRMGYPQLLKVQP